MIPEVDSLKRLKNLNTTTQLEKSMIKLKPVNLGRKEIFSIITLRGVKKEPVVFLKGSKEQVQKQFENLVSKVGMENIKQVCYCIRKNGKIVNCTCTTIDEFLNELYY